MIEIQFILGLLIGMFICVLLYILLDQVEKANEKKEQKMVDILVKELQRRDDEKRKK